MARRVLIFQPCVFLVISLVSICAAESPNVDNILVDCGSEQNTPVEKMTFLADNQVSWTLSAPNSLLATTTLSSVSSDYFAAIHRTARIFPSPSSYKFPIKTRGRHFVRFHFYPFVFHGYDLNKAIFSISVQGISLRKDFKQVVRPDMLRKEYSMNITTSPLEISFTPSVNSFAFVNGIEVVSVPDDLFFNPAFTVNPQGLYENLPATALETFHRVNMGGALVTPFNDTLGRIWVTDAISLTNPGATQVSSPFPGKLDFLKGGATDKTAPSFVYNTARKSGAVKVLNQILNITWEFDVDLGFSYLVRLHFCDIVSKELNQLSLNIYIGSMLAYPGFDLSKLTTYHLAAPYYSDFVVGVEEGGTGKLSVSISPYAGTQMAILNGLEIMKMNNSLGNLDDPIPLPHSPRDQKVNLGIVLGPALAVAVLAIILLVLVYRYKVCRTDIRQPYLNVRNYPFAVLRKATGNFSKQNEIGRGGFGIVYKGVLDNVEVAIKRAFENNGPIQTCDRQFETEIKLMSELMHKHLVSLVGFCDEGSEKILVYEFMQKGNLKQHLYASEDGQRNHQILSWEQRLEICIGAARGLHYIHTSKQPPVIHRDVKTTNILLDENLSAKIADFGISRESPPVDVSTVGMVSTVKGTDGYVDPEYQITRRLTLTSDVYSFGVVLWEVLCAIPVLSKHSLPTPQEHSHRESAVTYVVEWALMWYNNKQLDRIIDSSIKDTIMPKSLSVFAEIAEMCVNDKGSKRPSIGTVLGSLERALCIQQGKTQENSLHIFAKQSQSAQDVSSTEPENTTTTRSGTLSLVSDEFSMLMGGAKGR